MSGAEAASLALLLGFLVLSAFFSSSEAAFLSLQRTRIATSSAKVCPARAGWRTCSVSPSVSFRPSCSATTSSTSPSAPSSRSSSSTAWGRKMKVSALS